jgi:hypothetical protein
MDKPVTQAEIKREKQSKEVEPKTTVTNITSPGRMITLQLRDKNVDFYVGERSIYVNPGKSFTERASLFNADQLSNLQAKGEIKVLNG